jgi:hypothetical protein
MISSGSIVALCCFSLRDVVLEWQLASDALAIGKRDDTCSSISSHMMLHTCIPQPDLLEHAPTAPLITHCMHPFTCKRADSALKNARPWRPSLACNAPLSFSTISRVLLLATESSFASSIPASKVGSTFATLDVQMCLAGPLLYQLINRHFPFRCSHHHQLNPWRPPQVS